MEFQHKEKAEIKSEKVFLFIKKYQIGDSSLIWFDIIALN